MRVAVCFLAFLILGFAACETSTDVKPKTASSDELADPAMRTLDSLTQLLEKSPNDHRLLNERAKSFLLVGETNFALADVGRALMLDSTVADYFLTISDVYFRMNKPVLCLNALTKANKLQPEHPEPLYRLAQFSLYLNKYQESIDFANQMLKLNIQDDRPYVIKALAFKHNGDTAKAIFNYMQAVTENPDNYDAYVELGVLHHAKKDPLAENYFKAALQIRPEGLDAMYGLGMYYQENDKLNEALETYTQILSIDSTYQNAIYNIGYVQYQYLQLYNEALASFNKAVQINPNYYQAVYMRGLCYEAKGDVTQAKREYSYAIELNPNYRNAADGLNRLLSKKIK